MAHLRTFNYVHDNIYITVVQLSKKNVKLVWTPYPHSTRDATKWISAGVYKPSNVRIFPYDRLEEAQQLAKLLLAD